MSPPVGAATGTVDGGAPKGAAPSSRKADGLRRRRGDSPDTIHATTDNLPRPAVWSSGVPFYPPSTQLWRIGGAWYDFEPFLALHPGGEEVVRLARDRFEDATYAFESHHHNYKRARAIIAKYEVPAPCTLLARPPGGVVPGAGGDGRPGKPPVLLGDDAFYSDVRRRLTAYLRSVDCPGGGPTRACVIAFWVNFVAFLASWALMFVSGSLLAAFAFGGVAALLGAFGHNWVHQPQYRLHSYLSLDTVGFSSTGWFREHVLQHHMYTNTVRPSPHRPHPRVHTRVSTAACPQPHVDSGRPPSLAPIRCRGTQRPHESSLSRSSQAAVPLTVASSRVRPLSPGSRGTTTSAAPTRSSSPILRCRATGCRP